MIKPVLGSQLQLGHPLARGLVGCWLMNEGSGGRIYDLIGSGRHLTLVGNTYWTAGKFGSVTQYDGTADYSRYSGPIIKGPPFTVITWFKADQLASTKGDEMCVWAQTYSSGSNWYWWRARIVSDNKIQYGARNGAYVGDAKTTTVIVANKWHQAACVEVSSSERYVYLDADGVGGHAVDIVPTNISLQSFNIGYNLLQDPFDGAIGTTMIFNRALSIQEIAQLYREPFCMFRRRPIELRSAATQGIIGPELQDYYNTDDDSYMPCGENVIGAQTFTTTSSYIISSVKLKLSKEISPVTATVTIRTTDVDGKPTSNILCSGTIDSSLLSESAEWVEITFDVPHLLHVGIKYAITLSDSGEYIDWYFDGSSSPYSNGDLCYSGDNGSSWTVYDGKDAMFETWGTSSISMITFFNTMF